MPNSLLLPSINPRVYSPSNHSLNRGLVGWWLTVPGYTSGSDKWLDIGGRSYHGTLTSLDPGTDWVADSPVSGFGSLDFDNTTGEVQCGNIATTIPNGTVAIWTKRADDTRGAILTGSTSGNRFYVESQTSQSLQVRLGSDGYQATSANTFLTGEWTHIAMSWGADLSRKVWVNGVRHINQVYSGSVGCDDLDFGNNGFAIDYEGKIADVRLYFRQIQDTEINDLYLDSLAGYPKLLNRVQTPRYAPAAAGSSVSPTGQLYGPLFGPLGGVA